MTTEPPLNWFAIPELRFAWFAVLTGGVFWCAARFARRWGERDWIAIALDAFLLTYLVEYVAVCGPGSVRVLNAGTMSVVAVGACGVLWWAGRGGTAGGVATGVGLPRDGIVVAAGAFAVGFVGAVGYTFLSAPVLADDTLTYHFPVAARWLATGRLGLHETWFFNPANTYSPLGGSAFIAWIMGLMGNDLLADLVEAGALVMLFFALVELARGAGASARVGAIIAAGAVASASFARASFMGKDDLFVVAFFVTAMAGLGRAKLRDGLGPWRVGVAVGMLLSMKYTALFAVPVLLLAADAPVRAEWRARDWAVAAGCAAALAGPWFVRNWVLTGNPVYPVTVAVGGHVVWPGLFRAVRDVPLETLGGVWHVFTQVDDAPPWALWVVLLIGWAALVGVGWTRRGWHDPLWRALAFGPVVGVGLFLWKAPYAEIRFVYPVIALLFAGVAVGVESVKWAAARVAVAALIGAGAVATGFPYVFIIIPAVAVAAGAYGLHRVLARRPGAARRVLAGLGGAGVLFLVAVVYMNWPLLVKATVGGADLVWPRQRGPLGEAWLVLRDPARVAAGAVVSYTNTFYVYSLMGTDDRRADHWVTTFDRPVVYVPTRRGVAHLHDLPATAEPVAGADMQQAAARWAFADPDLGAWRLRLRDTKARYLFIAKREGFPEPPELGYVRGHPEEFRQVFDNGGAAIYEIVR